MPVQRVSPELDRIVPSDQDLEELGSGYGSGPSTEVGIFPCAEGPIWYREEGFLLFSDIGHSRRLKYTPGQGITLYHEPTNYANGLTRDPKGRLVACEQGLRRVTRIDPDGSVTVVAGTYDGTRLNRPNDVVVRSDGTIYFSDPGAPAPGFDLDVAGVYMVSPDLGAITLLVKDFVTPNGLAFSPDERVLYIDDSRRRHIRAFDVQPNGTLSLPTSRLFCELTGPGRGVPDGMKVDSEGNVYCTGPSGVWIINPSGKHLGTILIGENVQITNVGWGDDDLKTLYITTVDQLLRIRLNVPGVPVPAPGS